MLAAATPAPARSALIYQHIQPSIVLIQTERPGEEETEAGHGLGTGVVINADGAILTGLHVISAVLAMSLALLWNPLP